RRLFLLRAQPRAPIFALDTRSWSRPSMFDFVRSHTRLFQFVLLLVIFPSFVLVGISGYNKFTDASNTTVATVGSQKITQAEFDSAHRRQIDRIRRQAPGVDVKLFDTPQMRQQFLDGMVSDAVLLVVADKLHLNAADECVLQMVDGDKRLAVVVDPDREVGHDD